MITALIEPPTRSPARSAEDVVEQALDRVQKAVQIYADHVQSPPIIEANAENATATDNSPHHVRYTLQSNRATALTRPLIQRRGIVSH